MLKLLIHLLTNVCISKCFWKKRNNGKSIENRKIMANEENTLECTNVYMLI